MYTGIRFSRRCRSPLWDDDRNAIGMSKIRGVGDCRALEFGVSKGMNCSLELLGNQSRDEDVERAEITVVRQPQCFYIVVPYGLLSELV